MSTVGLTDARRSALALLADCRNADDFSLATQAIGRTMLRALHADKLIDDEGRPTKRGHAALAAPRMTQEQLVMLERCEKNEWPEEWKPRRGESVTLLRLYKKRWQSNGELTPAGRTALNNVMAAMGSPDWKEDV